MGSMMILFLYFYMHFMDWYISIRHLLNLVTWRLNGVAAKLDDIRSGKETINVAQVLRIAHKQYLKFGSSRFGTVHENFAPASFVLRPNVQLYSIEKDVAIFLEFDPEIELLNTRKNPLLAITQILHSRRLVILPRSALSQLVDQLDDGDDREVVWMFHTARCGSTVWAQIFNALPKWTVISESATMLQTACYNDQINDLHKFSKTEKYEEIVLSYIKMFMHTVPKDNSILWRVYGLTGEHMLPVIRKRYPNHKILFSYRSVLPTAKSFCKALLPVPSMVQCLEKMCKDIENPKPRGASKYGRLTFTSGYDIDFCKEVKKKAQLQPKVFEWYVFVWASRIKVFLEHRAAGVPIKYLHYDKLIRDPVKEIKGVFKHLGISERLVNVGVKSMELDSQKGIAIDHQNRLNKADWQRDEEQVIRCNIVLKMFGLPDLDSKFFMED